MPILVDIILVFIVAISTLSGYLKGLILKIYDVLSFFFILAFAFILMNPLANWIQSNEMYEKILDNVKISLQNNLEEKTNTANISDIFGNQSEGFGRILHEFGIDYDDANDYFNRLVEGGTENVNDALANYIVTPIARTITKMLSFGILLIAAIIMVIVIRLILIMVSKLPLLKGANKLLGAVVGLILGILIAYLIAGVFSYSLPYLKIFGIDISAEMLDKTLIFKYLIGFDFISYFKFS